MQHSAAPARGFYVTGTDTGIGKTFASTALLHALRGRGLQAIGMKPVASGCTATPDGWRNEDALALLAASDPQPPYEQVNPAALPAPLAPELAARAAGVEVGLAPLLKAYARLQARCDVVVVEGVGGWAAPLSASLDQRHLVQALHLPVVLVVGLRLGCINHARLTERALAADGVVVAGWICNDIDPAMAAANDNYAVLQARLQAPCWGRLAWQARPDPVAQSARLVLPAAWATTNGTGMASAAT